VSKQPFFVLMNCDLVAVALAGDLAQHRSCQVLYAGQLACAAGPGGLSEGRRQQLEAGNAATDSTLHGLAPAGRRIALFQPLVHSLDGDVASGSQLGDATSQVGGTLNR
jgi:hypothetical protein